MQERHFGPPAPAGEQGAIGSRYAAAVLLR